MSVDDATWGEIRRCICGSHDAVTKIAASFGVSVGAIRYRVRRDGWKRPEPKAPPSVKPKARKRRKSAGRSRTTREEVVDRLYQAIVTKLSSLEARMQRKTDDDNPLSPADSERETRELSTMVRSFEKVTGIAAELEKERKPKAGKHGNDQADAERMGREIAERLEALNAQWELEEGSSKSK